MSNLVLKCKYKLVCEKIGSENYFYFIKTKIGLGMIFLHKQAPVLWLLQHKPKRSICFHKAIWLQNIYHIPGLINVRFPLKKITIHICALHVLQHTSSTTINYPVNLHKFQKYHRLNSGISMKTIWKRDPKSFILLLKSMKTGDMQSPAPHSQTCKYWIRNLKTNHSWL